MAKSLKPIILKRVKESYQEFLSLFSKIPPRYLSKKVTSHWSAKDIVAHLIIWERIFIRAVKDLRKKLFPPEGEWEWDYINRWNLMAVKRKRELSINSLLNQLDRTHKTLLRLLSTFTEKELRRRPFLRREGGNFLYWFRGSWHHFKEHLPGLKHLLRSLAASS